MQRQRLLSLAAGLAGLAALAAPVGAKAELVRSGGLLGTSVSYTVTGDPGELFALLPSTNAGPTPLAILDAADPRLLGVGLDLLSLLKLGSLGAAGQATAVYPLPASPSFAGIPLYAQALTLPGFATVVDELSNVTGFVLGDHGQSHLALGDLSAVTAGYTLTALDDGRVLMTGGGEDDGSGSVVPTNTIRVFDPQTQAWTTLATKLNQPRMAHAAVKLSDGRVHISGGVGVLNSVLATCEVFDPATDSELPALQMSTARTQHTATALPGGRVFVAGGISTYNAADPLGSLSAVLKSTEVHDLSNNTSYGGPNLPKAVIGHRASPLGSGRVLLTGGVEVTPLIFGVYLPAFANTCLVYDAGTNGVTTTAAMSGVRALHGQATLSDGRVLVVGGADGDLLAQTFSSLATARLYDPGTGAWTNLADLATPRTFAELVEAAGSVHVIGGVSTIDLTSLSGTAVPGIESAPLGAFAWSASATMVYPRPLVLAAPIDGGERVLLAGPGDNGLAGVDDLTSEVYIP